MSAIRLAASASALALGFALAGTATAQEAAEVDEVVVTGTLLQGAMKTGALPVQVLGAEELKKRGDPSTLELIKTIPAVGATIGETNRLNGQNAGGYSINLRGLGADKTLVLLNGRRMPTIQLIDGGAVDAALMPSAALGRVEVLTDGAAATYGSDAMGGVVNFITRTNQNDFRIDGNYSYIRGSEGDYTLNTSWGRSGDWGNVLLAGSYYHRSELGQDQRGWAIRPFTLDPQNGWAASGNPGSYLTGAARTQAGFNSAFLDPGCAPLGGLVTGTGNSARCQYHNARFNNLVDDTDGYSVFGQVTVELPAEQQFHSEVLVAGHVVPHDVQQPSYAPSNFPLSVQNGGNNPFPAPPGTDGIRGYFIPANHPGLQTLIALNPGAFTSAQLANIQANGVLTNSAAGAWRPYGYGGNPLTGDAFRSNRTGRSFRVSGGFSGALPLGMKYDTALTYGEYRFSRRTSEMSVENLQWALLGLGGFGCTPGGTNPATSTPGQGPCLWFNPFSTGIASNAQTGQVNPQYAQAVARDPRVVNSEEVARFLEPYGYNFKDINRTIVADATLTGEVPLELWAGRNVAWAVGAQYIWTQDVKEVPAETNFNSAPCPMKGVTTCIAKTGPLTFFGAVPPYDLKSERWAVFGELFLPITDSLEAQLAVRHEDLGDIGTTTNPKASLRWQATEWLALRGSAGTTFKAPYPTRTTGLVTSGGVVAQLGVYKATDTVGNPDLKPEKADNFSAGGILTVGGLTATVDYYLIKLKGVIEGDTAANLISTFFGSSVSSPNKCSSDPNNPYWALQQRFTFTGGVGDPATCALQNLQRTRLTYDNKQDYTVSGLDVVLDYRIPDVLWDGDVRVGGDLNYVFKYRGSGSYTEGILITQGRDYAGTTNFNAVPRWKANAFAEYSRGPDNLRVTVHYIDGMTNDSPSIFPPTATNRFAEHMEAWIPVDVVYRRELPWGDSAVTLAILNVFDRDPPPMRQDFAYNTYTANPLGRVFRIGFAKTF
ncbi:TonB-dependent receptor domain-containing protein [Phenylobacterium sp. VNQ135]|uniref:TonB-dependent receptor domain-containing protein n=1 Tax=Phenylobacterium sp. VNQ135 TaxID=3400922 RepID=UPI003BFD3666